MRTTFHFHDRLAFGGEILTQPATFLPSDEVENTGTKEVFMSELKHLPIFGRFSRFTVRNNPMAQPLLYGGCNEMR